MPWPWRIARTHGLVTLLLVVFDNPAAAGQSTPDPLAVTLAAPNGGAKVFVNVPTTIAWSATGAASFDVALSRNGGSTYSPIAGCTGLQGSASTCAWIPTGKSTSKARVRVTAYGAGGATVSDISDGNFQIVTAAPSVTVTTPNTALVWAAGSERTLQWKHNLGAGSVVRIELSRNGGGTWETVSEPVVNTSATAGSYAWTVTGPATTNARIRVRWIDGPAVDTSDTSFSIVAPSLTVTAPNTAVSWSIGSTQLVKWNHNLGTAESVRIDVSRDGGAAWEPVAASVKNSANVTGSFSWIVTGPATAAGRMRVVWTDDEGVADASNVNFTVASRITVTAPNTAVVWGAGTHRTVTWNHTYGSSQAFDIDVSPDNGATWLPLAAGIPAATSSTGTYTGRMPLVPTSLALVRVSPAGLPVDGDRSNVPFTLAVPALAVTSPNTNVSWSLGSVQSIAWTHNLGLSEQVTVDVSRDGGASWEPIAASVANSGATSGSYAWTVTGPATGTARIRVAWAHDTATADVSDVDLSLGAGVSVTAPNTAVSWGAGTLRTVTWTHTYGSLQTFDIDVSPDGGANWLPLAAGVPAATSSTGSHAVRMPAAPASQALVRVSPAGRPGDGDTSNVSFTLATPDITVTAPNTNVAWGIGSTQSMTWTHNLGSAEQVKIDISRDGGASWEPIAAAAANSAATSGSFAWTVTGPATAAARVRVAWAHDDAFSDGSDADFGVGSGISVTGPNTGVVWGAGTLRTVTWTHTYGLAQIFDIDYSPDNGGSWTPLAAGVPAATASSGAHVVRMPVAPAGQALVRISPSGYPADGDTSDVPFTLAEAALTLTAPDTDVSWSIGSVQSIAWTHNLGSAEQVRIDLSRDGGTSWEPVVATVANSAATSGAFTWTVTGPATAAARIRVAWAHDDALSDTSDADFRVGSGISVTQPNTAVSWGAGTLRTVTWTHAYGGTQAFDVDYSPDGGGTWTPLASGVPAATPSTGAHTVRLPVVLTSQALVRISPAGNPGDGDTSDVPFALDAPSLAVAAPDINVTWPIDSIQSVAWAHNLGASEQVQIDVSRDGGATWESVAATLANSGHSSGTFNWPVTGPETATARIRVTWLHDTTVADTSDVDFVIGAASGHAGTTRYVSKTGIDTGDCTDAVIPCRTIRYGISTMDGGDTLIVGNGTYTEANAIREVPSGNSGPDGTPGTADDVYTTIRAETDFGVLIDGSAWPDSWIYGIRLENKSYITVRGFRVHGRQSNETGGPLHVQGSHHIKLIRCGFAYGGVTGNTANGDLGPDNDYVLIEESYAYGGARYQFLNYWGDHTVIRRSVARNDYWNDSLQAAAFVNYDSVRTVWQNNIAIDSDSGCCTGHSGLYAAFFSENKTDHAADTSQEFHGNIVLNFDTTYGAHLDWVASGTRVLRDNIFWHATGGYWGDQGPGVTATWPLISNLTSGAMTDTYNGPNDGAGLGTGISIYGNLQNVVRNSLFVNNNSYGVADFVNGDFNAFWGNGANYGGTRMPMPGVNDITTHDVLFQETTNPFGSLKYLPRGPEDGSLLATAGENGSRVGAQVLWKIGLDGTLYGEPGWDVVRSPENGYGRDEDRLWPFPNEAVIKAEMGSYSGAGLPGARGFAAPGTGLYGGPTTLTSYIWEYLGHPCPPDVCR